MGPNGKRCSPNSEAQIASKEYYDMVVDIEYEQYMDDVFANEEMLRYSSQSRDIEDMFYGTGDE